MVWAPPRLTVTVATAPSGLSPTGWADWPEAAGAERVAVLPAATIATTSVAAQERVLTPLPRSDTQLPSPSGPIGAVLGSVIGVAGRSLLAVGTQLFLAVLGAESEHLGA
jgi:hypothetical protein